MVLYNPFAVRYNPFSVLDIEEVEEEHDDDLGVEEMEALALLVGELPAPANAIANAIINNFADHVAGGGNPLAVVAQNPPADGPQEAWKMVIRRTVRRSSYRGADVYDPPFPVCELYVLWEPKVGRLRNIQKWAQARKSGCTALRDGRLANFTFAY